MADMNDNGCPVSDDFGDRSPTLTSGLPPCGTGLGGVFDDLPGGPWKQPQIDASGFVLPAMTAMKNYASDQVGEATCVFGDLELTVRVLKTIQDPTSRTMRVFQFIADEFEVLTLFPEDMRDINVSFRGSELAFTEAAELFRTAIDNTLARGKI